jgi:hypothetical protein
MLLQNPHTQEDLYNVLPFSSHCNQLPVLTFTDVDPLQPCLLGLLALPPAVRDCQEWEFVILDFPAARM